MWLPEKGTWFNAYLNAPSKKKNELGPFVSDGYNTASVKCRSVNPEYRGLKCCLPYKISTGARFAWKFKALTEKQIMKIARSK